MNRQTFTAVYLRNVCEDCYKAILEEEIRRFEDEQNGLSALEELEIYQRFREEARETLHWIDFEDVDCMFQATYGKVRNDHAEDAMAYC